MVANVCAFPVTRSLNLAPRAIKRSHSLHPIVGCFGSMHANHAGITDQSARQKHPFPSGYRIPVPGSCGQTLLTSCTCIGDNSTAAYKNKWLLCLAESSQRPAPYPLPEWYLSLVRSSRLLILDIFAGCCRYILW